MNPRFPVPPRRLLAALPLLLVTLGCTHNAPRPERNAVTTDAAPRAMHTTDDTTYPTSPVTLDELKKLQQALLFDDADVAALRMSRPLLEPRTDAILDVWYGFVASLPQLVESFRDNATGAPDGEYLAKVRVRFGAWILETADAEYDQAWLDHQNEIALRHHSSKKNVTDGADSTPIVPLRYITALVYPVTATLRPFLEAGGHSPEEVDRMHQAWTKSVLLQAILWSEPYVRDGEF